MKTILNSLAFALVAALVLPVAAVPTWKVIGIETAAYDQDQTPAADNTFYYAAYYCTQKNVEEIFGSITPEMEVTPEMITRLKENFIPQLTDSKIWESDLEQYVFAQYFDNDFDLKSIVMGVVLYENGSDVALRIFENCDYGDSFLVFNDDSESPPPWLPVSVPEPTSGLLLLLGIAGLTLRRGGNARC